MCIRTPLEEKSLSFQEKPFHVSLICSQVCAWHSEKIGVFDFGGQPALPCAMVGVTLWAAGKIFPRPRWLNPYDRLKEDPLKDDHSLTSRTCEYAILHGKKDFWQCD